jgi:hypothetical protein
MAGAEICHPLCNLNEIQVLGSHNSYHIRPLEPLPGPALLAFLPVFYQIDYTAHPARSAVRHAGHPADRVDVGPIP